MDEHKAWQDPTSDPIGDVKRMIERSKAEADGAQPPPEIVAEDNPRYIHAVHGRGFGKRARLEATGGLLRVERPVAPSSRSKPAQRALSVPRATSGHVVWRGVPSWFQVREPSRDPAHWRATQSPPWVRKRRARRKTRLAKVSRRANRAR